MKNICITPEAISEMIIEDWISESKEEYTWQLINLEKTICIILLYQKHLKKI